MAESLTPQGFQGWNGSARTIPTFPGLRVTGALENLNMDSDKRMELIEAQTAAAAALEAGQKLATRAAKRPLAGREVSRMCMDVLGATLATPSAFWAGASMFEAGVDVPGQEAMALAIRYAAARMAVGDMAFVRESLLGQSQWASILAVKLSFQAGGETRVEDQAQLVKLAMQAQRQAAQALATAAALNKLVDADTVVVDSH